MRVAFWAAIIIVGALYSWTVRHSMNSDGVVYLDLADALIRGDFKTALSAYWSPLYSWILAGAVLVLQPSSQWEFPLVHLVNYVIFLVALASFEFFMQELLKYNQVRAAQTRETGYARIPDWALKSLGYGLFVFFALGFITLWLVTPDMLVAALIFLAAGILLRIRTGRATRLSFVLFGLILGLGYLAKTSMLPMALVFLGVALLSGGNLSAIKKSFPNILIATVIFLLIIAPFVGFISTDKGRLTIGDSGKLNYAWWVNKTAVYIHWQGENPESGIPTHPTRRIYGSPAVYEFAEPVAGTYPAWFDPSYWYEGLRINFDISQLLPILQFNAMTYFKLLYQHQWALVLATLVLLFQGRLVRKSISDILEHWSLLLICIAGLSMYAIVTIFQDPRYIAPYALILWMLIFSQIRVASGFWAEKAAPYIAITAVTTTLTFVPVAMHSFMASMPVIPTSLNMVGALISGEDAVTDIEWQVAEHLRLFGVEPGDKVAIVGDSFTAFWARLAKVQIVSEIPSQWPETGHDNIFWRASDQVRSEVLHAFAQTGSKVVVTKVIDEEHAKYAYALGWRQIGLTNYFAYSLVE